jgi:hypothetical protein
MLQPNFNIDEELDAELRAVPLPEGFTERLRRAALSDEALDAAVRTVAVPPALVDHLRPGRFRRQMDRWNPLKRARQWATALSLLLILGLSCLAIMAGLLVVVSLSPRPVSPELAHTPGKPADVAAEQSGRDASEPRPEQLAKDDLLAMLSPPTPMMKFAAVPSVGSRDSMKSPEQSPQDIEQPLVAGANKAVQPSVLPTSRQESGGVVMPLASGPSSQEPPKPAAPENYDEVCQRAKLAWDLAQAPDLQPDQKVRLQAEALDGFQFAVTHAPRDAKSDELGTMRYCLAYLHWVRGEYRDAASLGESLAHGDPKAAEAQQGAKIALSACVRLFYDAAAGDEVKLEKDRMVGMAQFIAASWPGSPVGDEAQKILIHTDRGNTRKQP